jgi:hypothetical protein
VAEYILFKVSSGEEIIGEDLGINIVNGQVEGRRVQSPRMLIMQQGPEGIQVGILPYSGGDPDGVHVFQLESIVSRAELTSKHLEDLYIQNTSQIQIVSG